MKCKECILCDIENKCCMELQNIEGYVKPNDEKPEWCKLNTFSNIPNFYRSQKENECLNL